MSELLAHDLEAKWRSDDVNTNEERDFSCLNLDRKILAGLSKAGYKVPSPVQLQAIPLCLTGNDVFVQGKAGTGKTLVFSILALTTALKAKDLKVLILATTREGAFQIYSTICAIGSKIRDLKCECFIGGFDIKVDELKAKECTIAVGTPGRILHLIEDDKLKTDTIQLFIIDDFDDLLDRSMKLVASAICNILPEGKQTVVTSLTCIPQVIDLASEFLKEPYRSFFNDNEISLLGMTHYYRIVPVGHLPLLSYRKKLEVLKKVLFKAKFSQCVIYCNSVFRTESLCIDIKKLGFSAVSISIAKDQVERLRIIELFKKNKLRVLVSTDVSSRCLDAQNVDLVINFDLPSKSPTYLRRCGRAGRFGAKCASITFLLKHQTEMFDKIENEGQFISYALPDPIPENLSCDINPSAVPSMSCNLKTTSNSNENFPASTTETSINAITNVEKTMAREACSLCIANENGQADLEDSDKGSSGLIANKIEEHTVDLEAANVTHLMRDLEIANENGQADLEDSDEGSSGLIANKIEEHTVDLEAANVTHLMRDLEMIKQENECAEGYQDTAKINGNEPHLLSSCVENTELPNNIKFDNNQEPELFNKKCESKNCEQEMDLCSASETVPKCTIKPKPPSKLSEESKLHEGLDEIPLERVSKKMANIPEVTRHKKRSSNNIRKSYNKKSVKSSDQCKSQSKFEKQVGFCGLKTTLPEFGANQSCTKFCSECLADHINKKKVNKCCKMHSSHGKYVDRFNSLSLTGDFNVQRNPLHASSEPCHASSQPCCRSSSQPCRASSQPCCRASSQPCCRALSQPCCRASSQHGCHFSNNYHQPPFPLYRNDIFYQQWMYINNLSNYMSNYLKY